MPVDDLAFEIRQRLERECGVLPGTRMVLAVSGGADSMALMHALVRQPRRWRGNHVVAHLDHGLRGDESRADAEFVRETADRLGLEFRSETVALRDESARTRESLEMSARRVRHAFLARIARTLGIRHVALAHHSDDQVELFFLRLLRGSGTGGLGGMRSSSPSPADPEVVLVRPWLGLTAAQLRGWLAGIGAAFREDASNTDISIPRNAVRHRLMPLLRELGGESVESVVRRTAEIIRVESDWIEEVALAWRNDSGGHEFSGLPLAIRRRVVVQQLLELGHPPAFELVEHLAAGSGQPRQTKGGVRLVIKSGGRLDRLSLRVRSPESDHAVFPIRFHARAGSVVLPDALVKWSVSKRRPPTNSLAETGIELLDADAVGEQVILRRWRSGDRYRPLGAPGRAKVGDIFTNRHVPVSERPWRWVMETDRGLVCWVEGLPPGHDFRIRDTTKRMIRWRWNRPVPSASA